MNIGDVVDVFDRDLRRWVPCRFESIGELPLPGGSQEVRVFHPIDTSLLDQGSGLRLIYGIPWPDGEPLTRSTPAGSR